jgi:hypothetical protein
MSQTKGTISENDLMYKLVQAKKVMNKVDKGDYQRGNVDTNILNNSPEEIMESNIPSSKSIPQPKVPNVNKIMESKLPDAIKKAMIDNPIPQISLNETLDMNFVQGAKRLMEQEGLTKKPQQQKQVSSTNTSIDMNAIAVLIENTVRKVMDEKLNQILSAQQTQTINENLVLKVGDSIFKGKITGVNKSK